MEKRLFYSLCLGLICLCQSVSSSDVTSSESSMCLWENSVDSKEIRAHDARREAVIKNIEDSDQLPSFRVLMNETAVEVKDSFRVVWDSAEGNANVRFLDFLSELAGGPLEKADPDFERKLKDFINERTKITSAWRGAATSILDQNYDQNVLKMRPILRDSTVAVPIKPAYLRRVWVSAESFLTSDSLPEEIVFILGIGEGPDLTTLYSWMGFHQYLSTVLAPAMPRRADGTSLVSVKIAVHRNAPGPGVSRRIAALHTNKSISFNFDSDDYLMPTSLRDRYYLLQFHPELDLLLSGLAIWEEKKDDVEDFKLDDAMSELAHIIAHQKVQRERLFGKTEEAVCGKLREMDVNARIQEFNNKLKTWYSNPSVQAEVSIGSLRGLPNISDSLDCAKVLGMMVESEHHHQGHFDAQAEALSFDYMHQACLNRITKADGPSALPVVRGYVLECANGWNVARTKVLQALPATISTYGEDALLNFLASKYGFNAVCYNEINAGIYNFLEGSGHKLFMDPI